MYQYVLVKCVPPPFTLSIPHTNTLLPLSTLCHCSVHYYKDSFLMVSVEDSDELAFLWLLTDKPMVSKVALLLCMLLISLTSANILQSLLLLSVIAVLNSGMVVLIRPFFWELQIRNLLQTYEVSNTRLKFDTSIGKFLLGAPFPSLPLSHTHTEWNPTYNFFFVLPLCRCTWHMSECQRVDWSRYTDEG